MGGYSGATCAAPPAAMQRMLAAARAFNAIQSMRVKINAEMGCRSHGTTADADSTDGCTCTALVVTAGLLVRRHHTVQSWPARPLDEGTRLDLRQGKQPSWNDTAFINSLLQNKELAWGTLGLVKIYIVLVC